MFKITDLWIEKCFSESKIEPICYNKKSESAFSPDSETFSNLVDRMKIDNELTKVLINLTSVSFTKVEKKETKKL